MGDQAVTAIIALFLCAMLALSYARGRKGAGDGGRDKDGKQGSSTGVRQLIDESREYFSLSASDDAKGTVSHTFDMAPLQLASELMKKPQEKSRGSEPAHRCKKRN